LYWIYYPICIVYYRTTTVKVIMAATACTMDTNQPG
jgi:hypothetical protein